LTTTDTQAHQNWIAHAPTAQIVGQATTFGVRDGRVSRETAYSKGGGAPASPKKSKLDRVPSDKSLDASRRCPS